MRSLLLEVVPLVRRRTANGPSTQRAGGIYVGLLRSSLWLLGLLGCAGCGSADAPCIPAATEPCNADCSAGGVRVCGPDGTFGACECTVMMDQGPVCACTASDVEMRDAGACGQELRTCGRDCQWGTWVLEPNPSRECEPGEGLYAGNEGCDGALVRHYPCTTSCEWSDTPSECGGGCGGTRSTSVVEAEEICIPAASFTRGCDREGEDCYPRHEVYLSAFYIDRYPVTNQRYTAGVDAGACTRFQEFSQGGFRIRNFGTSGSIAFAATHWQAERFCEWDGAELATGAQWERAATGHGGPVTLPWTEPWCDVWQDEFVDCGGDDVNQFLSVVYWAYPLASSSYGLSPLFYYFEWTADTLDPYAPMSPPERDPRVVGTEPYEIRGAVAMHVMSKFRLDVAARNNTLVWGNPDHAAIRCARPAVGERLHGGGL